MREIAPGLHIWTAAHPNWDPVPEPESPADWPEQVGCVLFEGPDAVILIDPVVPEQRWGELDERIAERPVVVLTTMRFHGRSRDAVLERCRSSISCCRTATRWWVAGARRSRGRWARGERQLLIEGRVRVRVAGAGGRIVSVETAFLPTGPWLHGRKGSYAAIARTSSHKDP
jgi:hypothetical protein